MKILYLVGFFTLIAVPVRSHLGSQPTLEGSGLQSSMEGSLESEEWSPQDPLEGALDIEGSAQDTMDDIIESDLLFDVTGHQQDYSTKYTSENDTNKNDVDTSDVKVDSVAEYSMNKVHESDVSVTHASSGTTDKHFTSEKGIIQNAGRDSSSSKIQNDANANLVILDGNYRNVTDDELNDLNSSSDQPENVKNVKIDHFDDIPEDSDSEFQEPSSFVDPQEELFDDFILVEGENNISNDYLQKLFSKTEENTPDDELFENFTESSNYTLNVEEETTMNENIDSKTTIRSNMDAGISAHQHQEEVADGLGRAEDISEQVYQISRPLKLESSTAGSKEDIDLLHEKSTTASHEEISTESQEEFSTESQVELSTESPEELSTESPEKLSTASHEELSTESPEELSAKSTDELSTASPVELSTASHEELSTALHEELSTESSKELSIASHEKLSIESPEELSTTVLEESATTFDASTVTFFKESDTEFQELAALPEQSSSSSDTTTTTTASTMSLNDLFESLPVSIDRITDVVRNITTLFLPSSNKPLAVDSVKGSDKDKSGSELIQFFI